MKNAIYLDYGWFSGDVVLTDSDRNDYVLTLKDHGINQQFCDIGVLQDEGTLPIDGCTKLSEWIKISRLVDPSQAIIPVINHGHRKNNVWFGSIPFNTYVNKVVTYLMTTFDIDGIHLDIERFQNNDEQLIALLKTLKGNALATGHLSISTPITPVWSGEFITRVAQIVDQINPMIYDTMGWGSEVIDSASYQAYFKAQVLRYVNALATTRCQLVPTTPAYELKTADDNTIYHDPAVESMQAAIAALNEVRDAGYKLDGAGIFWGPHYMGLHPTVYPQYQQDQEQWKANWIRL